MSECDGLLQHDLEAGVDLVGGDGYVGLLDLESGGGGVEDGEEDVDDELARLVAGLDVEGDEELLQEEDEGENETIVPAAPRPPAADKINVPRQQDQDAEHERALAELLGTSDVVVGDGSSADAPETAEMDLYCSVDFLESLDVLSWWLEVLRREERALSSTTSKEKAPPAKGQRDGGDVKILVPTYLRTAALLPFEIEATEAKRAKIAADLDGGLLPRDAYEEAVKTRMRKDEVLALQFEEKVGPRKIKNANIRDEAEGQGQGQDQEEQLERAEHTTAARICRTRAAVALEELEKARPASFEEKLPLLKELDERVLGYQQGAARWIKMLKASAAACNIPAAAPAAPPNFLAHAKFLAQQVKKLEAIRAEIESDTCSRRTLGKWQKEAEGQKKTGTTAALLPAAFSRTLLMGGVSEEARQSSARYWLETFRQQEAKLRELSREALAQAHALQAAAAAGSGTNSSSSSGALASASNPASTGSGKKSSSKPSSSTGGNATSAVPKDAVVIDVDHSREMRAADRNRKSRTTTVSASTSQEETIVAAGAVVETTTQQIISTAVRRKQDAVFLHERRKETSAAISWLERALDDPEQVVCDDFPTTRTTTEDCQSPLGIKKDAAAVPLSSSPASKFSPPARISPRSAPKVDSTTASPQQENLHQHRKNCPKIPSSLDTTAPPPSLPSWISLERFPYQKEVVNADIPDGDLLEITLSHDCRARPWWDWETAYFKLDFGLGREDTEKRILRMNGQTNDWKFQFPFPDYGHKIRREDHGPKAPTTEIRAGAGGADKEKDDQHQRGAATGSRNSHSAANNRELQAPFTRNFNMHLQHKIRRARFAFEIWRPRTLSFVMGHRPIGHCTKALKLSPLLTECECEESCVVSAEADDRRTSMNFRVRFRVRSPLQCPKMVTEEVSFFSVKNFPLSLHKFPPPLNIPVPDRGTAAVVDNEESLTPRDESQHSQREEVQAKAKVQERETSTASPTTTTSTSTSAPLGEAEGAAEVEDSGPSSPSSPRPCGTSTTTPAPEPPRTMKIVYPLPPLPLDTGVASVEAFKQAVASRAPIDWCNTVEGLDYMLSNACSPASPPCWTDTTELEAKKARLEAAIGSGDVDFGDYVAQVRQDMQTDARLALFLREAGEMEQCKVVFGRHKVLKQALEALPSED